MTLDRQLTKSSIPPIVQKDELPKSLTRQLNGRDYYYYVHYYKKLQAHLMRDKLTGKGYHVRITYGGNKWTLWVQ